jgi:UDP-N-acetylglucosamine 2-epimerase (non-hydrolysing)/GDP/UDP-N,N'-diacetylbacillosamine 2-epimerase (hydrolysing)
MYWLMREIKEDPDLELQIITTGMHLSPEFGLTYREIEKDGFVINEKVEMLLSSDTPVAIAKSIGLGTISFADAFDRLKPDIIVVLGDRFEILAACSAALPARIPIAHLHGGEATEGAIDEAIRHAITKMAHLHFVATEKYRERVIQMGEQPERVFCFGAPGLDNIRRLTLLERSELEKSLGFKLSSKNILITYHPVTLDQNSAELHFGELLAALERFKEDSLAERSQAIFIFTKPNADTDGRIIIKMINDFVQKNSNMAIAFDSLGQVKYLSALKHVDMVVGNSSSGLCEAPSFKIPTINIGDRQKGRIQAQTVISCDARREDIAEAIKKGFLKEFRDSIKNAVNPYDKGEASLPIKDKLKQIELGNGLIKKEFYNIPFELPHKQ